MKKTMWAAMAVSVAALALGTVAAFSQANEDDFGKGPGGQTSQFPMAAKAGVDSHAIDQAPAGAVNQGKFDDQTWKFGHRTDAPAGSSSKLWNPAKIKLNAGGKVVGGTLFSATDPETYCAMANAGYDYIWVDHQHDARDWVTTQRMWAACPYAKAVPGVRVAYTDEREEQHALDAGALVLVVPTVRSIEEGTKARDWALFPPLGRRSFGGGQGAALFKDVPGGYRATFNDNLVLIFMIETLAGLKDADKIAKLPGLSAVFAASGDLGNHSGYRVGDPDYEREINIVHDAALKAHIRLCGPYAWKDRPDFTCFQATTETGLIAAGAKAELGPLYNTQGKPTVGPWAAK